MQRKSSESSGSSKHTDSNPEVIDGSGSSIGSDRQIDVITRVKSGKSNYSDTLINGTKNISASARMSYSSSSSESSSDDSYQMDALKFTTSGASNPASKHGKNYVSSSESSAKSEVDNNPPVPTLTFQVYNATRNQNVMSPTVSPPVQVMDRSGGYDPSRIPSSVFERNTIPLEWSVASNESLFSLNIGNASFSRENAFMFGELGMSEELTKSGELSLFSRTPSVIFEEIDTAKIEKTDTAEIEEIDTARKSVNVENLPTNETSAEASKLEERFSEDQNEKKDLLQAASRKSSKSIVSSHSLGSGASVQSFAFPVKKRARPLCYCSNCSCAFCYCRWPTCCHTWPVCKCSNCGWAFCYCWNCSHTQCCGHASPILTEAERNSPLKTDIPRQQSYKQESEVTSKSTASCCSCCNWFHCFSCPSCCTRKSCYRWKPSCTWCKCRC